MQATRLPFFVAGGSRHAVADVVLEVGGDALQAADRDRLVLDAAAPAGRLARPIAGPPENAGKDVRLPVDHIGVAVATGGDQADVFGDGGVGRAGPLAIDDFVEIVGRRDVIGSHASSMARAVTAPALHGWPPGGFR